MGAQNTEITRLPGVFYDTFGAYVVYGTVYRDQGGKKLWLLNVTRAWSENRRASDRDYWVTGAEFRKALGGHLGLGTEPTYFVGEIVEDLEPDERKAAIEAINRWEGRTVAA